jgi:hypothetical protein
VKVLLTTRVFGLFHPQASRVKIAAQSPHILEAVLNNPVAICVCRDRALTDRSHGLTRGEAKMQTMQPNEITLQLRCWSEGDRAALDQLMPVVYQELRKLADSYLRRERPATPCNLLRLLIKPICGWSNRISPNGRAGGIFTAWPLS